MIQFIFLAGAILFFWLMIVMPQRRRRQLRREVIDQLEEGDEVMTVGGIFGFVREVGDRHVVLEIAPETRVRLAKSAVTARAEGDADATETEETSVP